MGRKYNKSSRYGIKNQLDIKKACPKKSWPLLTYEKH
ncbi:hypothetical protein GGU45_004146 [Niabella hirudinis]